MSRTQQNFSPKEIARRRRHGRRQHRLRVGMFSRTREELQDHNAASISTNQRAQGGKTQGAANVKSGWLDKIRDPKASAIGGKKTGPITGRRAAESGQLARALHHRWHVAGTIAHGEWRDPKPSPRCEYCIEEQLIVAFG